MRGEKGRTGYDRKVTYNPQQPCAEPLSSHIFLYTIINHLVSCRHFAQSNKPTKNKTKDKKSTLFPETFLSRQKDVSVEQVKSSEFQHKASLVTSELFSGKDALPTGLAYQVKLRCFSKKSIWRPRGQMSSPASFLRWLCLRLTKLHWWKCSDVSSSLTA